MARETVPLEGARMACGCVAAFRHGVEGSPITVVITRKAESCQVGIHVAGLPVYDHREALRPPTRHTMIAQPDFEEEG